MKRYLHSWAPGWLILCISLLGFTGCAEIIPKPFEPSDNHITPEPAVEQDGIPDLVEQAPVLPEPEPPRELEKYTVVVNEVPVRELLFALARDARINVDIASDIEGIVTINAVDQTLPQLLDRIARQVDLRYEFKDDNLIITPDDPFFRTYVVDYLNMTRETTSSISTDTGVGGDTGSSTSTTSVSDTTSNRLWLNLVNGVNAIIGAATEGGGAGASAQQGLPVSNDVIPLPESGILTVRATRAQHELVQNFIDIAIASANRQVLIQATVLEVKLSDDFQAGIDWTYLNQAGRASFDFASTTLAGGVPEGTVSSFVLDAIGYAGPNDPNRADVISASISLLEEFGNVRVLSSPQLMTLNNQTSILKVVDNFVYFEVDVEPAAASPLGGPPPEPAVDTTAKTVPVGIVMSLTPQINENDSIILQVRPTITDIIRTENDPNPALTVPNRVPVIQTREMESVLRMHNGQVAVLGGLMQDTSSKDDTAIPGLSRIPLLGEAFKTRTRGNRKTELVIFIRPTIIRTPSLDGDLRNYRPLLERNASGSNQGSGMGMGGAVR